MSVNIQKKSVALKEVICSKYGQTKVENDLIVPDTKPDIEKILQVCGRAVITQKTSQQDKAYIRGVVYLTVIYRPEGISGVKSIFSTLDFSHIVEAKGAEAGSHIWSEATIEEIDYSIVNSRKLTVKCCVGIDTKISRTANASLPVAVDDNCKIQTKCENRKLSCCSAEEEQDFIVREKLEIPSGKPDANDIIKFNVRCASSDFRYESNRIIANGDIEISLLYLAEDNSLNTIEETVPFNETLEGINLPEGDLEASYIIKEANFDIDEDIDGSRRFINMSVKAGGVFRSAENIEADIISDAFGTEAPVKLTKSTYNIENLVNKSVTQIAHKESIAIPDYMPGIYRICDCGGEARVTGISIENGRINVDGEILSNILYLAGDDEQDINGLSHISSFSRSVDIPNAEPDSICEAKVELDHIGYNINSDRSLELRFIIILTVAVLKEERLEIIDSIEADENCEKPVLSPAIIYFPEEGETVWDIAKKYMATPEKIKSGNGLEGEILKKGQKICIFR